MTTMRAVWMAALVLAASGCSAEGPGGSGTSAGGRDGGAGMGGFDGGGRGVPTDGAGGLTPEICEHIDMILSVDTSGSMSEERMAMASIIFPGLARELVTWEGIDFRVGVNDACPSPAEFQTTGVRGTCTFSSGQPWMVSDSPNLVEEFMCIGDMYAENDPAYSTVSDCTGDNSDNEAPGHTIASMLEAAEGGGLGGFLRTNSLVVLVPLTDEDEDQPDNYGFTPREIYDRIVASVGDPRRVFFLAIAGASNCDGVYGHAENAIKLKETAGYFSATGNGAFWDLCGGSLEDGLDEALSLIRRACENLPPCDEFAGTTGADCYPAPPPPPPDAGTDPILI